MRSEFESLELSPKGGVEAGRAYSCSIDKSKSNGKGKSKGKGKGKNKGNIV